MLPKSSNDTEHLWIIVAEIDVANRKAICVNVTTQRSYSDITCILNPGEKALTVGMKNFVCSAYDPCSPELLARVQKGLIDSKQTPKGIKARCKAFWGRE